jgi:hypothetical protein
MILSPYSNRGVRIGARISVSEEREREILEYTYAIWKKNSASTLALFRPRENLRSEGRGLLPAGALDYWGDRILAASRNRTIFHALTVVSYPDCK